MRERGNTHMLIFEGRELRGELVVQDLERCLVVHDPRLFVPDRVEIAGRSGQARESAGSRTSNVCGKGQDSLGLVFVVVVTRRRFFRFGLLEDLHRSDFAHHLQARLVSQREVQWKRKRRGKGNSPARSSTSARAGPIRRVSESGQCAPASWVTVRLTQYRIYLSALLLRLGKSSCREKIPKSDAAHLNREGEDEPDQFADFVVRFARVMLGDEAEVRRQQVGCRGAEDFPVRPPIHVYESVSRNETVNRPARAEACGSKRDALKIANDESV